MNYTTELYNPDHVIQENSLEKASSVHDFYYQFGTGNFHQITETKPRGLYQCITLQVLVQDTKYFSVTFLSVYPTLPSPLSLHHPIPPLLISLPSSPHLSSLGLISTVFGEEMA